MELKIIENTGTRISFHIEKEDFSIPNILHQELVKDPRLKFAGVIQKHPILKKYLLTIESKELDPIEVMIDCCKQAIKNVELMEKEINKALEKLK